MRRRTLGDIAGAKRRRNSDGRRKFQPLSRCLEQLEERLVLSAVSWTGGGDGSSWTDPNNWTSVSGPVVPGQFDDVTIGAAGSPAVTISSLGSEIKSLTVAAGASLTLTSGSLTVQAPSTIDGTFSATNSFIEANGAGASLTVNGATTINTTQLDADGGVIDLPQLTSYTQANGFGDFQAFLPTGAIDLPNLTTLNITSGSLLVRALNGGQFDIHSLATIATNNLDFTAINEGDTVDHSSIDLSGLTSFTGSGNTVDVEPLCSISLSKLATLTGATFDVGNTVSLPDLADIDNTSLLAFGVNLSLPLVTSYTCTSLAGNTIESFGTGTQLSLNNLTTINASQLLTFQAFNGGVLNLDSLASTTSGDVQFQVQNAGGTINVPALTSVTGSGGNELSIADGGTFNAPQLATFQNGAINTAFSPGVVISSLTNIDNCNVNVTFGDLSLPGVISFTDTSIFNPAIISTSVEGTIRLANLASTNGMVTFETDDNGLVDLPQLSTLSLQTEFIAPLGTINLPALTSITGLGDEIQIGDGKVLAPNLARFNNGKLIVGIASANFPALTNIDGLSIDAQGELSLPSITSYVNSSGVSPTLQAENGGQLLFPHLLTLAGGNQMSVSSSGDNSNVEFDALVIITGGVIFNVRGTTINFELVPSFIRLPALKSLTNSQVELFEGADGQILVPQLNTYQNIIIQADSGTAFPIASNQTYLVNTQIVGLFSGSVDDQGVVSVQGNGYARIGGNLDLNGSSTISIAPGATLEADEDIGGNTTNSAGFHAAGTVVLFNLFSNAANPQHLEAMSQDLGAVNAGFNSNFEYGTLEMVSGYVQLVNQLENSPGGAEAVYANQLIVGGNTTLDLNGLHLYVRSENILGTVINGTVSLLSGGVIQLGQATGGTIATVGQQNNWTFSGFAGQAVTVKLNPDGGVAPTAIPPALEEGKISLLDPNGNVLTSASSASFGGEVILPSVDLSTDGTYTIRVEAADGDPTATGNYVLTAFSVVTPSQRPLTFDQQYSGAIANSVSADQWNFSGTAGQQVDLHAIAGSDGGIQYDLTGPGGTTLFADLSADSGPVNLPATGNYVLTVHSNVDEATNYAFQLDQTSVVNLALGDTYSGSIGGTGFAQLFTVNVPVNESLFATLQDSDAADINELYARFGAPPSRGQFDVSSALANSANQQLLVPSAAPGTWYILVYGNTDPTESNFTLQVTGQQLKLAGVTPNQSAENSTANLVLNGSGFNGSSTVQLVSANNTVYQAASVSFDTNTQLTATFNLTGVPQGTYTVQVTNPGNLTDTLPGAFKVTSPGQARLVTQLLLPGAVGRHIASTFYVEYSNVGNVAMPAPILVLESSVPTDLPLFTLDASLRTSGFWTSSIPQGYSNTIQILASGKVPGILEPGESITVPVYYAGMQMPWDFSHTQFKFDIRVLSPDDTTPVDWTSMATQTQPPGFSTAAWNAIYGNIAAQLGGTMGGYVQLIDSEASYLGKLGENVTDISRLWQAAVQQQNGLSSQPLLVSATDLSVPSAGLSLDFSRQFLSTINGRFTLGPLGYGWTDDWQELLSVASDGTVTVTMPGGAQRVFQPDSRGSDYFTQPGDHGVLSTGAGGTFTLTETNGQVESFNGNGTLGYIQDLNGNRITAGYAGGQLTSLTSSSGNSLTIGYTGSLITSVTSSDGRTVTYDYDANQQLSAVHNYDGTTTTYTYDSSGNPVAAHELTSQQLPTGVGQFFTYDSSGRLSGTSLNGSVDPITYTYNLGMVAATDAKNNTSKIYFNETGLIVKTVDPLGNAAFSTYDTNFNLVNFTDPSGLASRFTYDQNGNLINATNSLGQTSSFTYAGVGNLLTSSTDAVGNTTKYSYDASGDLTSTFYPDQTTSSATYDALGDPLTIINQNGQVTSDTYNGVGQITGETLADGTQYTFGYDSHGNLTSAVSAAGTITLAYDAGDRLTQVLYPNGLSLTYTYNAAGQRVSMVDQNGNTTNYIYDAVGRLASLTDGSGTPIVTYTFNSIGQLSETVDGNGGGPYTTYAYDADGNLLHLINYAANGTINSRFDYTYNVLTQVANMTTLDGTWTYTYDSTGELTHALFTSTNNAIPNQDLTYVYNAAGDRTQTIVNGVTSTYASNSVNEYTTVTSSDGTTTNTYDADGNLISKTDSTGTTTYSYDSLKRLISVTSPTDSFIYEYDALGNLSATIHNGQTTQNLVDPTGLGNVVGQYDGLGNLLANYTYGLGLVSQVTTGGTNYYQFGTDGSTANLTDATGTILNSYSYLPFGGTLYSTGSAANPFTFVGQFGVSSDGNGLFNMRARSYDPNVGQFISNDPLGLLGRDVNLRRYVGNDPISFTDAKGTENPKSVPGIGISPYQGFAQDKSSSNSSANNTNNQNSGEVEQFSDQHGTVAGRANLVGAAILTPVLMAGSFLVRGELNVANTDAWWDSGVDTIDQWLNPNPPGGGNGAGGSSSAANSQDPNSLIGPAGFGSQNYVAAGSTLPYQINFENDPSATAPAQAVTISDPLDSNLDPSTFRLTSIGFGDTQITIPAGSGQYYETTVSMTYNNETFNVEITAGINLTTNTVFATFQSIDPGTSLPPDVLTGFLPPEDGTGRGMGYISYIIQPKSGLATGTQIHNIASITFDSNSAIATDLVDDEDPSQGIDANKQALVTIDVGTPSSSVSTLPTTETSASFTVSWSGQDDASGTPGSGIASFDIYMSDNGSPFTLWKEEPGSTLSDSFTGVDGHTYAFYSIASDNVGHVEATPSSAEASTTVHVVTDTTPPSSSVTALPQYETSTSFTVNWLGQDNAGGSGLANFDIYVSDNGGPYTLFQTNAIVTSALFTGQDGHTYSFYSVATDNDNNVEAIPSTAEATTLVDVSAPTSSINALTATQDSENVHLSWLGGDGANGSGVASFTIYVSQDGGAFAPIAGLQNTNATTGTFVGQYGHSYRFYSIAADNAGNVESAPGTPDASVSISDFQGLFFDTASDTLRFGGSDSNDTLVLAANGKNLQITLNGKTGSKLQVTVDGQLKTNPTITLASLHQINLYGHAGDDAVTLTGLAVPVYFEGGLGNNSLIVNSAAITNAFALNASSLTDNGTAISWDTLQKLTINGQSKNDTLTVNALPNFAATAGALAFSGGGGTNTLVGPNTNSIWNITGAGSGALVSSGTQLTFTGVQNLTGGTSGDNFKFSAGQKVSGKIDGGGGSNALDDSAYTSAVTVNLQTDTATGTGGFANIASITGGASTKDILVGPNSGGTWNLASPNAGSMSGTMFVSFHNFENITGGSGTDNFVFYSAGSLSGKLDGGKGTNLLDVSGEASANTVNLQTKTDTAIGSFANLTSLFGSSNTTLIGPNKTTTWNITGPGIGNVSGLSFTAVGNLTGGTANDTFTFVSGAGVSGVIDGGKGTDTLNYAADTTPVTVNLSDSTTTGAGLSMANFEKLIGGSASDTLIAPNTANIWKITASNAGAVGSFAFSSVENQTGGALADRFILSKGVGVSGHIDGGAGNNTLDYSAYTTSVNVNLPAGTATNIGGGISHINVVLGGSAADILTGGAGRDILFGEAGADTITGGGDDDLLFNDTATFASNPALIDALLTYWNRTDFDFTTRVTQLRNGTTAVAGLPKLNSSTVKNDTSSDILTGGAGLDWFFAKVTAPKTDAITDLDTVDGEQIN